MKELTEYFSVLYKYRELISSLVAKDLKSRYRGSVMGMAWTFLNPLLTLSVYALVFSRYQRIEVPNYAVFMFAGLLPWIWFSSSLLEGVNSITGAGALITKSMFPAEILPMVKIISNLFNYLFSLPLLFGFMLWFGVEFTLAAIWLPFLMAGQLLFTTGLVYFVASLNVRFRDVQHMLANIMLLWFFLCPIIYPKSAIPPELKLYTYSMNPMAHLAVGYQDIFIFGRTPDLFAILMVMLAGGLCMILGIRQFERGRETFAEEI
ncbi:MAG: ABC transporter permease [Nitrospinota bacterium]|nr:ABC transporter permease [Nitrospinota bacterium]